MCLTNLPKFRIIYRVCDTVMSCTSIKRDFNISKFNLIKNCLEKLKIAINNTNNVEITLDIVVDSCSKRIYDLLLFDNIKHNIYIQNYNSNPLSFCKCVEIATKYDDSDIIMFLEDDYLILDNKIFDKIYIALLNNIDAIFPDDYPEKYINYGSYNTVLFQNSAGVFAKTEESTCTFATTCKLVKEYKSSFMKFIDFPLVDEYNSIDIAWREKTLCCPIPGYTLHVQLDRFIPPYISKNDINEKLNI